MLVKWLSGMMTTKANSSLILCHLQERQTKHGITILSSGGRYCCDPHNEMKLMKLGQNVLIIIALVLNEVRKDYIT